jgi:hypothetical protein
VVGKGAVEEWGKSDEWVSFFFSFLLAKIAITFTHCPSALLMLCFEQANEPHFQQNSAVLKRS